MSIIRGILPKNNVKIITNRTLKIPRCYNRAGSIPAGGTKKKRCIRKIQRFFVADFECPESLSNRFLTN